MKGHPVSEETKRKISETAKRNGLSGGYRRGSGRGKKGWYKGFWCDSTYELAFVVYCLDHGIFFSRNDERFLYRIYGKDHYYLPDFLMADGSLVEIKGYLTMEALQKVSVIKTKRIKVLFYEDIKYMIDYISERYMISPNRLYDLYDGNQRKKKSVRRKDAKSFKKIKRASSNSVRFYGIECAWCGKTILTKEKGSRYCGAKCSNLHRLRDTNKEERLLKIILGSRIDLLKFGYCTKLCNAYPDILTKRTVLRLLRKYSIPHYERRGAKCASIN